MDSARTAHNEGTPSPFFRLPTELRHCVYRFLMPCIIRPRKTPLEMVFEDKHEQKLSIALFLVNRQVYEELSYFLYQYNHFVISINCGRVACVALESPILWELGQTESISVKLASSIRHIDIDLECVERRSFTTTTSMNLRLTPLLEYVCEHLRAFRCLQTIKVRWKMNGDLSYGLRSDTVIFILGPLEQLQADMPRVQITVQATQQQSKSEIGDNLNDLGADVKLQDYLSRLRKHWKRPKMIKEC